MQEARQTASKSITVCGHYRKILETLTKTKIENKLKKALYKIHMIWGHNEQECKILHVTNK